MKRYWLFGGSSRYAKGGGHDLREAFNHPSKAVARANREQPELYWWHVVDTLTGGIVRQSKLPAYGSRQQTKHLTGES